MKSEQGFTLIETLAAILLMTLAFLLLSQLWHAAQRQLLQSELHFAVSREAVNRLEEHRPAGTSEREREIRLHGVVIHETERVEATGDGLQRITLHYSWKEGGRTHEQVWAAMQVP